MSALLISGLLVVSGCFGGDGASLFNDDETTDETIDGTTEDPETYVEGEPFGYLVEGTQCYKQIHGGCVPYDYVSYEGTVLGIQFMHPLSWVVVGADEVQVTLVSSDVDLDEEGNELENDPTTMIVWREPGVLETYKEINSKLIDAGTSTITDYEVTWEIYEGVWNEQEVTVEWIWLTYHEDTPNANFVFFLMTETENFDKDQAVIKAATSSIGMDY